ncbi:sensor histidine kinase [Krasilnikoviella flava]|uniref:histidine kinase n=1 Tax=Krasilnikoviella flava TaxID=526729 RepID=A0A1T5IV04_9MICO|nr:histidine kinase [Krasilnikoviella flava]SKC42798.1 Signal transduction histidine kinase [Krasilnikoviella flava]
MTSTGTLHPAAEARGAWAADAPCPPPAPGPPRVPRGVLVSSWVLVAVLTVAATAAVITATPVPGAVVGTTPQVPAAVDISVAVAAVALVPLLFTRRSVAAAVGLAVLAAVSGAATPAATVGTLQVARWYPVRTAAWVAGAGVLGHAVQALWRPVSLPLGWWLLCDVAVHAALFGWGAYGRERALVLWSLRDRARRAEAEQERRVAEARTAERTRIAREMHDTLAHRLSLLAATAGAMEYRPDADPTALAAAAGRVRAGVSDALEDLRQVIRLLRAGPDDLGPVPGLDDVRRLVDDARAAGNDVGYERTGDDTPPAAVATAVFRVVQEGLTNARRHAPGAAVRVTVATAPGEVRVRVADDGARPGSAPPEGAGTGTGTGLVGLRERATLLGGTLTSGPAPGPDASRGFGVEAWLPWDA